MADHNEAEADADDTYIDDADADLELAADSDDEVNTNTETDVDDSEVNDIDEVVTNEFVEESPLTEYSNEVMIVPNDERRTTHWLTDFEVAEIISVRISQISRYSNCLADVTGLTSARAQAERELSLRLTPLKLRRNVGLRFNHSTKKFHMYAEIWKIAEMTIPISFE